METIIYEFLFNDCIYESSPRTVSIHRTKKGAYKAMNKYINDYFNKERDCAILGGHKYEFRNLYDHVFKSKSYFILPIELQD
jgi:hypothetical protein